MTVTAKTGEPRVDARLFSHDDQLFHALEAGIDAGQHEGGGKSVEIRRFGFNLDHGGVNGGLKVLVDGVEQNQTTQGHGQGYLGSLKTLSPELIGEVTLVNGPFSAEYGDFSGLGVVHIRTRESLPDRFTARAQAGSYNTRRGFFAWSPRDGFLAYEGSATNGPFRKPLDYRRDNVTGHWLRRLNERQSVGVRLNGGRSHFSSSGQLPLDEVEAGRLDRFGFIDPNDGGSARSGTLGAYWQREGAKADVLKLDGFVTRSLFDLDSNFTFFLKDPVHGDAIHQHDSRFEDGMNAQYVRPHRMGGALALLTAGGNFHDNQISVGVRARVTNGAGYAQESASLWSGRVQLAGGLRYDEVRFRVGDGAEVAGRWQPKAGLEFTPSRRAPVTFHATYGRGISTADGRAVVQHPENQRIATTDFYRAGVSHHLGRLAMSEDVFLIDRSREQVYIPDDGSFEFRGPSRAYGFETRLRYELTRRISLSGGLTKVANAFYRDAAPRVYVASAPHFVANAGLTAASWKGWSGSLRLRSINRYRLDGTDQAIVAAGHTVLDLGASRQIRRGLEFNIVVDNLTNRTYYETQNYFESRLAGQAPRYRIHGTPGYPLTAVTGLTWRLGGK